MKQRLIAVSLALGLFLFVLSFYFFPLSQLREALASVELRYFWAFLATAAVSMLIFNYRWWMICKQHNISINFWRLLTYRFCGFAVSVVTPGPKIGGEPVRAALVSNHTRTSHEALSTVLADKTIELITYAMMIVLALAAAAYLAPMLIAAKLTTLIIGLILFGLILFGLAHILNGKDPLIKLMRLLHIHKLSYIKRFHKHIVEFEHQIQKYYADSQNHFWGVFWVSMLAWVSSFIEHWWLLKTIGIEPTLPVLFLVYAALQIAYLLPLPLALGGSEFSSVGAFAAIGKAPALAVVFAVINRARDILWMMIGYLFLGYYWHKGRTTGAAHESTD